MLDRVNVRLQDAHRFVGTQLDNIQQNWALQQLTKTLGINWLWDVINRVDVNKARQTVARLRREMPQASAKELSQALIRQKIPFVGGVGFASGVVPPGLNLPVIALDIITTLKLQTELVYEIACAYGLDLNDPERKGELLWVLALGLGSDRATTGGINLFEKMARQRLTPLLQDYLARIVSKQLAEKVATRFIPIAGGALGAAANMTFLYLLGRTAIGFYEKQAQGQVLVLTQTKTKKN